jgi:hypothetical protein
MIFGPAIGNTSILTGTVEGGMHYQARKSADLLGACGECNHLIAEGKARSADDIRELMSGNICRCGASGLSRADYAQRQGLNLRSLHHWIARLRHTFRRRPTAAAPA